MNKENKSSSKPLSSPYSLKFWTLHSLIYSSLLSSNLHLCSHCHCSTTRVASL